MINSSQYKNYAFIAKIQLINKTIAYNLFSFEITNIFKILQYN